MLKHNTSQALELILGLSVFMYIGRLDSGGPCAMDSSGQDATEWGPSYILRDQRVLAMTRDRKSRSLILAEFFWIGGQRQRIILFRRLPYLSLKFCRLVRP